MRRESALQVQHSKRSESLSGFCQVGTMYGEQQQQQLILTPTPQAAAAQPYSTASARRGVQQTHRERGGSTRHDLRWSKNQMAGCSQILLLL